MRKFLMVIFCLMLALFVRPGNDSGTVDDNPGSSSEPGWYPSDRRLKTNIRETSPALDYLLGLPIRDYTEIASRQQKTGVVAQELLDRYPELVRMNDNGLYSVTEPSTWKVIKGIQDLYGVVQGKALVPYTPGNPAAFLQNARGGAAVPGFLVSSSSQEPATPPKGQAVIYMKPDGNLYFKNDLGEEKLLSGSLWSVGERGIFYTGGAVGIGVGEKLSGLTVRPPADKILQGATSASKAVEINGTGTHFLSELGIGDRIAVSSFPSSYATVTSIDSDSLLSVDVPLGENLSTNQTIAKKSGILRLEDAQGIVKVMVNDLGWVGVGTRAPAAALDVSGRMRIYDQTPKTGQTKLTIRAGEGQGVETHSHASLLEIQNEKGDATVSVDAAGHVGIGTTSAQSALHVADGRYAQFENNQKGPPLDVDCGADSQRGRIFIDTKNNRLYLCNGARRGWDWVNLSD